ncbi:hypothetical protein CVD25_10585 [Bacillus canaveralius]|uniref:CBS domain-containing protein n=1 Tax=Bacillus canaveralius TaxID=1403243 RepID=A0A2N5GM32_9BACI|nr:DUF294 nucleotidyltransferase-like domain-containing protein [Bacillus canaveralius]PLR82922.1 hypothetical protein CU635_10610 [Bacillus canaveralius]PLR97073.1 hypothetical protein CVD25_10585 [Bacillus canaveralius]
MADGFESYEAIKIWKDEAIHSFQGDTLSLNEFHDRVLRKVYQLAACRLNNGSPPCSYSWFITGSGGRFEQGLISDQDHGIIYERSSPEAAEYFLRLGEELSLGMAIVGYPYCEGKVMSSNPLWCQSKVEWKAQLLQWLEEESWQSIRYLHIFYDSRPLVGAESFVNELKSFIYDFQKEHPKILMRLLENVMHMKNAVGPFGQIIPEEKGLYKGSIDLKNTAIIPYVNAVRILALKEGIKETSTLARIDRLTKNHHELLDYRENFRKLLSYRLSLAANKSYDEGHYLSIKKLSKAEKHELKKILKDGKKLQQYVQAIVEKGVRK